MNNVIINEKDKITMKLVHYFITKENYTPIIVNGAKNEIWLENAEGPYKIIRINSNYIHNEEQFKIDIYKIRNIIRQVRKKTLSLSVNTLNIVLNINENVKVKDVKDISSIIINNESDIYKNKNLKSYFPTIKVEKTKDGDNLDFIIKTTKEINKKTEKENIKYENTFKKKKIVITYALIALNILMFMLMYIFGNGSTDSNTLIKFGANFGPLVKSGQLYRLISCAFLHIGIIHLLVNMYSLYIIGTQIENYLGKGKFVFIYLFSAITASLMSIIFSNNISAGASGAIFGLLGSLLYFGYYYRVYLSSVLKTQIIPIIILNLALGFMISGIDNAAHIGGLVGGAIATMAVGINNKSKNSEKINGWIVLVILLSFLSYMVFFK